RDARRAGHIYTPPLGPVQSRHRLSARTPPSLRPAQTLRGSLGLPTGTRLSATPNMINSGTRASGTSFIPRKVILQQRPYDHPDAVHLVRALFNDQVERYGYADP